MNTESTRGDIPSIRLWDLLLVPLQGEISDAQVDRLTSQVLGQLNANDTAGLIVDVTGLWMMDSHLCSSLSKLASASALMGAKTVLCGLSPEIAVTLQTMGLQLGAVVTVPSLEDALMQLGVAPVDKRGSRDDPTEGIDPEILADLLERERTSSSRKIKQ